MSKVLLFTSQDIGDDLLNYFHSREDTELAVVTQRTKRDEIYGYRATADLCISKGVKLLTPAALNQEFMMAAERFAPDLIVSAYYPRIFPRRLIELPPLGCINVHPGMLPYYRGKYPTPWHILNNEHEIGVTIHHVDGGVDTGDILVQRKYPIGANETGHELYRRSMKLSADLLIEHFDKILRRELDRVPQPAGGSCYNWIPPRYEINWNHSRIDVRNQIRVHAKPYFPAYCFVMNKCLAINRASYFESSSFRVQNPGLIVDVFDDKTFLVSCSDGLLLIEDYELFPTIREDDITIHISKGSRL